MHIDNGRRRNPREPTHPGHRVIAVDLVPERIELARSRGIEVLDLTETDDVEAPRAYEMFRKKADGAIKILLQP